MKKYNLWNNILGWAVFAIATISYLLTMEPTASLWDCSEFIATSYKLEVGHPPGAPLFMMLARIASLFAPSPEAVPVMINAMNCVASGFCVLFLFWTITHLARRIISCRGDELTLRGMMLVLGSGFVGALSYAYTDTFWFSAVEGEVYALSSMFTALVVWLMLKWEEEADEPSSMRWIILIAYLMGLSIGVHILNLLTIPALVMIYFFRRYEMRSVKEYFVKIVIALIVSLLILGAINGVIIPYTVALGAAFDTFAVNTLGMPVNSGIVVFLFVTFAALGWLVMFSHRRGMRVVNVIALSLTVILIGFSSYASVTIRAAANPPMNSNDPSTPHSLLSMLNRDQYGQRPLLWGPYYSATPLPLVESAYDFNDADYYRPTGNYASKRVMWLNPESGKYEQREFFEGYAYPSEANHFLPRMWYFSRRDGYQLGWVNTVDGHPTVERSVEGVGRWWEPTALEDVRFLLGYQMGDMFWRYFMWNFVGRQDDTQLTRDENGVYLHGGWLSGIGFIDKIFCGPQDNLPREMAENPARNTYFFMPLLLGLLGLVFQLNRDWRNFFVVLLLFVMMGIALVIYFNTAPDEPRERDYVYAGAFYAFCIWIGLGVMAVADLLFGAVALLKSQSPKLLTSATVLSIVLSLSVPVVLASENWDDHDRSGRYMARDIGWNYLVTAPENAIVINFGDNDTFPLWYCQEVEGVRPDVRVMNSSYLGGEWYIDEMKLAANDADAVPFTIPATKYSFVNDWVIVADVVEVLDAKRARELRAEKRRIDEAEYYDIRYADANDKIHSFTATYYECSKALSDAVAIIDRLEPVLDEFMQSGSEPDMRVAALYDEYVSAYNLYDAILANEKFVRDYDIVGEYWRYSDDLANCELNLKDVIRLFNSDEAMTLVVNDNRMLLLEEGEVVPETERKADYRMVGKLQPKIDSYLDGALSDYILASNNLYIDVDKEAALAAGIIDESDLDKVVDKVKIKLDKTVLTKDYLMMLDLFANFDWKRPLSFTQAHLMRDYGIVDYARFDGYCYTFVPIYTRYTAGSEPGSLNIDKVAPLLLGEEDADSVIKPLRYGNLSDEDVYVDYFYRFNMSASRIRENFARVASGYIRRNGEGDLQRAESLLNRGLEVLPPSNVGYVHTAILPYIRGYYYIAQHYMNEATSTLAEAVALLSELTGVATEVEPSEDTFSYFYDLSDLAAALQSTARREGKDTSEADALLARSDAAFAEAERCFNEGDALAAEYIVVRAEWVDYYLQYATKNSFTPTISDELYNVVLDILDVLRISHEVAGSFDWVANTDSEHAIVEGQASFDEVMQRYVTAIDRITPADSNDPRMALFEMHISNIFDVYSYIPSVRYVDGRDVDAVYVDAVNRYLDRSEVYDVIVDMFGE